MQRKHNLAGNTLILGLGTLLPKLASLVTLPILTARLTKAEYGTYDLVALLATLLIPVVTLRIESGCFRFLIDAKSEEEKDSLVTGATVYTLLSSLLLQLILFFALYSYPIGIRLLLMGYMLLDTLGIVVNKICLGLNQYRRYSVAAVVNAATNLLLILFFVQAGDAGLAGVLAAFCLSSLCALGYLIFSSGFYRHLKFARVDWDKIGALIRYSWPVVPGSLLMWVINMSDRLVVLAILGIETNALYAAANRIARIVNQAFNVFNLSWQDSASAAAADEDPKAYYAQIQDRLFRLLSGCVALLLAALPILFYLLVNKSYDEVYPQIPILVLGALFACVASFYYGIFIARKETKRLALTSLYAALLNLLLNFAFIRAIGLYAASLSTLVSFIALSVYRYFDLKKLGAIEGLPPRALIIWAGLTLSFCLSFFRLLPVTVLNLALSAAFAAYLNHDTARELISRLRRRLRS